MWEYSKHNPEQSYFIAEVNTRWDYGMMWWSFGAVILGVIGAILVISALVVKRYRDVWFYWIVLSVSLVSLVSVPVFGMAFGVPVIVILQCLWSEFGNSRRLGRSN